MPHIKVYNRNTTITSQSGIIVDRASYNWNVQVHTHDFFEVELILSGRGMHTINGYSYEISTGDAYILSPSDLHSIQAVEPITRINISYTENSILDSSIFGLISSSDPLIYKFSRHDFTRLTPILNLLLDSRSIPNEFKDIYIKDLCECVIIKILDALDMHIEAQRTSSTVYKALLYISLHFREPITLKELADEVQLSPNYFSSRFNSVFNMSVTEYINEIRLKYAYNKTVSTYDPIEQIASDSGFGSYSVFSRCFKNKYGASPSQIRKRQAQV